MRCELVFVNPGSPSPLIPSVWSPPRADQMHGTWAEKLVELAGRGCYDSLGTGRGSKEYHQHLLEAKHYSVHEHVHATIETDLPMCVWHGIPDYSMVRLANGKTRLTLNLRHCLEWPWNVVYQDQRMNMEETLTRWGHVLQAVAHRLMPNVLPDCPQGRGSWHFVHPEYDTERFVSLFLEDSRVWSHEQVRHRFNISQRSGRFCDETDRDDCIHPLFREYLNEAGYLALNQEDGHKLWMQATPSVTQSEIQDRTKLGNAVGSHLAQAKFIYSAVVEALQPWIVARKGLDKTSARKQARSAARYYLGNGLSTELVMTASLRSWRGIFDKRCASAADAPIRDLMEQARAIIESAVRR